MTKQIIRTYLLSDKVALFNIFKHYIPSEFAPDEIHDFENYLENHGSTYFTFVKDGKVIGGIGYELTHKNSDSSI